MVCAIVAHWKWNSLVISNNPRFGSFTESIATWLVCLGPEIIVSFPICSHVLILVIYIYVYKKLWEIEFYLCWKVVAKYFGLLPQKSEYSDSCAYYTRLYKAVHTFMSCHHSSHGASYFLWKCWWTDYCFYISNEGGVS